MRQTGAFLLESAMSDHLEVFDTTLAETHVCLKAIAAELSLRDQRQASQVPRAPLHALRPQSLARL